MALRMRRLALIALALSTVGCGWIRGIPDPPAYPTANPLPFKVGVVLGNTPETEVLGPAIAEHLKEMNVFQEVIYPYTVGDEVDGVLRMTLTRDFRWGLTPLQAWTTNLLFVCMTCPILGPQAHFTHDADVVLYRTGDEMAAFRMTANSRISSIWGLTADRQEVDRRVYAAAERALAVEIGRGIVADSENIFAILSRRWPILR